MEYRQLGSTGIQVSALSLGSWLTYEYMEEEDAFRVIDTALQAGVNFLDDARYNDRSGKLPMKSGYSEVLFGRLLRRGGWKREGLFIANKLWYEFYPQESPEAELDASLARLQMEYLDLAYCAPPPASVPVAEVVRQMDELIRTGKLRYWGVLNWTPAQIEEAWRLATAEGLAPPCAAQLVYSLLAPSPVEDAAARQLFDQAGISVVASYSLAGGLLTGKYNESGTGAGGRLSQKALAAQRRQGNLQKVEQLVALARDLGCTPAQLALAYCLKNRQVTSVLFGATSTAQVEENLGAVALLPRITEAVQMRLRDLSRAND